MARLTLFVLLLAVVSSAQAEVMDKEPSLMQIILWGLFSSTICLFVARYKPWFLFAVVPLPIFYFSSLVSEIRDPFVGPELLNEAGRIYIYSSYGLSVLVLVSIAAGILWRAVTAQHNKRLQSDAAPPRA